MSIFTKEELIIMSVVVALLVLVMLVLTILDIKDFIKSKKNKDVEEIDLDMINEPKKLENIEVVENKEVKEELEVIEDLEVIDLDAPVENEIEIIEEDSLTGALPEEIIYTEETPVENIVYKEDLTKEEAIQELNKVKEELRNLDNEDPFADTITYFEMKQEEDAIISLDELMKVSDKLYANNEIKQYDDGDEPITIDEVINKLNGTKELEVNEVEEISTPKMESDVVIEEETKVESNDFLDSLQKLHDNGY